MFQVVELELTLNGLKIYSGRRLLDFEVWKSCFVDRTTTVNLANEAA